MPLINLLRSLPANLAGLLGGAVLLAGTAFAAGPRWTTGLPFYNNDYGNAVVWYTPQPLYFTDPGDLSPYVNHAAADALVAAAAATWNLPTASIVLAQGGSLNEHVSSANVYLGSSGPVFPADVQASNFNAKQIAVIYDSDGSVTDTLLGGGASDPSNCRQSAVTESVDGIYGSGQIVHALIILNGRCTGSASALQMEMKYRLIRAFGRILGLGWSQLNDNVFTGTPQPTTQQLMNWPIMHPIDVLCGPYAYQCMPQPFTLRTDDIGSLTAMYPVYSDGNGKTGSFDAAASVIGTLTFPNGQGMEGILVSVRRYHFGPGYTDAFDVTSGVTGATFQQNAGNPITPKGTSAANSNGTSNQYYEGYYSLGWIPIPNTDYFDNLTVTTSAINPLYTGQYAVGPYVASQVTPSGTSVSALATVIGRGYQNVPVNMTSTSASATCSSGGDGTVYTPLAAASIGTWSDTLCGYQHSAWSSLQVQAGRTLTVEVTATDEQGYATVGKMLPVIGVWDSNDSTSALPTLASQSAPLNASTLGMTNLMVSNSTARTMRIGVADQRGDGRPDYGYNARILYADSISPASLPANGGAVTISGMGFHPGNTVTINGIAANVTNWTANSITLVAPAITGPLAADVTVTDLSTGGQTTMSGALTYSQTALPDVLTGVSKPADGGFVGSVGSPVFKVQVSLPDGVTPAAGVGINFSSAAATFGACSGASTCILTTDSNGFASSAVTPTTAGAVALTATVGSASVSATFVALAIPVDGLTVVSLPSGTVYATLPASAPFTVKVTLPGSTTAAAGANVVVAATNAALAACSGASTCTLIADASGMISTILTPSAAGLVSLLASAGGGMVSASFGATALPADVLRVVSQPADGSYAGRTASAPFTVQAMLGDNATPASSASVTLTTSGATLSACGASTCVLTADATGSVSTSVVPTAPGSVTLTASAGGGTISTSFNAVVVPPDALHIVSKPANGSYVARTAALPFSVQVLLGDTGAPAAGVSVIVSTSSGVLNACAAASCTLTADSTGTVSTTVMPSAPGTVNLTASAGGGTVSGSFLAAAIPPDTLTILTKPANGSYVGRTAALPFSVQVFSGETGAAAATIAVTVTASGATLSACSGTSSCVLTADSTGTISTAVIPSAVGTVSLSAAAGGGTISTTFTAAAIPPDTLHLVTQPANGSYVGRTATIPYAVQVALGDTGGPASGVSVLVSASNGVLNVCGAATCTLTADSTGTISTSVTPSTPGTVGLTATAGGGTVSTTFSAVAVPPDALHVVTQPANGSYVGRTAAIRFAVQVALGDTGGPAVGVSVSVSATNALINACGAAICTLTADSTGTISTSITPASIGSVSLIASAGGGTVSTTFTAAAIPPDTLNLVTQPANGSYAGRTATVPYVVQVALGDTGGPANGVSVVVSASNGVLNVCGAATCTLTADSTGTVSTTVTPTAVGTVVLSATAGGGSVSSSFLAAAIPPDTLNIVTRPIDGAYVGRTAVLPFSVQITDGATGAPAAGVSVAVTATGATLDACGGTSSCILTADSTGTISTTLTPTSPGIVSLSASAGGGIAGIFFNALSVPPDGLTVLTRPTNGSYVGRTTALPFTVQVSLGDTGGPAGGVSVTVSATNAIFTACAASTCTLVADSTGTIATTVTPSAVGLVGLTASAGGGTVSTSFNAAAMPPDNLQVVTAPANNTYAGSPAAIPFAVSILLGDGVTPASSVSVTVTASGATIGACGLSMCTMTANILGIISTSITAPAPGAVTLTASAGGGTVSTTFTAISSPDTLQVVSAPSDHSFTNQVAAVPFVVKATINLLSNARLHALTSVLPGSPDVGQVVTLTAVGGRLNACGLPVCILTTDSNGNVSTTVTPLLPGPVTLLAAGAGATASTIFAADTPPDTLQVTSTPANGSYANRVAATPFTVQVLLGDGVTPAAAVSTTLTATNATLGVCGLATCVVTANASGMVSTTVTPATVGSVQLTASAAGGTTTASFTSAAVPADILHVTAQPANGSYVARAAAIPFTVQTLLGDTNGPATGAVVTLTAVNATLGACNLSACTLTADSMGTVSTTVTPTTAGSVQLTATAGGGTTSTTFTAAAVPPDTLHISSQPANGSYVGRVASAPFAVQVSLGDTGGPAAGASVTVTASNASFGACGLSTCTLTADSTGTISTTVTPVAPGTVTLSAASGGGTTSTTFTAAAVPPDSLQVVSHPEDGSYAGTPAATRFAVQTLLGDTGAPAAGVSVTVTASNATLGACNAATCILTADSAGTISTAATPLAAGSVLLTATAGGGTVTFSFNAAPAPVDALRILSQPSGTVYATLSSSAPFTVQVMLPDGRTPASNAAVTLSATHATFASCGGSASCALTADASGTVSTTVTPQQPGTVTLQASAGGGTVSTTFTALALPPDILAVVSAPSGSVYVGTVAASSFAVHILLGDGFTPASGAPITLTASGATFGSCVGTCTLTADASGNISTTVTPTTYGTVTLTASSGGGTVTSTFTVTADVVRIVSSPAANSYTGTPAAAAFAAQVLLGDGATPVPGAIVTVSATGATLGACSLISCSLTADAQGMISTAVTATTPGTATLTASSTGGTASTSFTSIAPPDVLQVISTPANGSYVGRASSAPFTIQVSLGTASNRAASASINPNTALPTLPNVSVTLSATGATLDACGLASCTLLTGALGTVSSTVTPTAPGPVTLSATAAGGSIATSFTAAAQPNVLHVTSVPANGTYFGRVASTPFAVQILQGDGTTPASGVLVTLTASNATLACGLSTCILASDSTGAVSTTVTPSAAGTVGLSATAGGGTTSASFTAATPPDMVSIVSAPANGAYTGRAAAQPFTVKVLLGDGVTPAAGASVTLTAANATLAACNLATCTSLADATGTVSTTVIPLIAGTIALSASAAGGVASASFIAIDPVRTISFSRTTEYVATSSTVIWTPTVALLENGLPVAGVPVTWTTQSTSLALSAQTSTSSASGLASMQVTIGPLASGDAPVGTACAWTAICATFAAQSVDASAWRLVAVSGETQAVTAADTLQPLSIRAVDDAGDWIAGVPIQINQLVRGWVACPPLGRCPLGPVLSSTVSNVVSDVDGLASIPPTQVPNTPETTGIVAAAGPNGYLAVSLSKTP